MFEVRLHFPCAPASPGVCVHRNYQPQLPSLCFRGSYQDWQGETCQHQQKKQIPLADASHPPLLFALERVIPSTVVHRSHRHKSPLETSHQQRTRGRAQLCSCFSKPQIFTFSHLLDTLFLECWGPSGYKDKSRIQCWPLMERGIQANNSSKK